jgi:hypothetical protein
MKKVLLICLVLLVSGTVTLIAQENPKGKKSGGFPFYIYADKGDKRNHFFPSGWMGDFGDIKVQDQWKDNPQSGPSSLQIKYTAEKRNGAGWAGIYWQNPANNWGTKNGAYDLTGAKNLFFYARGEKGGETVEFKMGGLTGDFPDSGTATCGQVTLTKNWQLIKIDLVDTDMSFISGGFVAVFSADNNPDGFTIYLDNIYYSDKKDAAK